MTGTVEVTGDRQLLLIRFPYREDLVEEVRTMPGRRWDRGSKAWRVPVQHVEVVVTTFLRHGFTMAPEVTGLLAGTDMPPAAPPQRQARETEAPADAAAESLTVTQLNERVREVLRGAFPERLWVVGEILDYEKNRHRAHVFFTLAEKREGQAQPAARVDAVLFETAARRIDAKLQIGPDRLTLQDGIEIRALVRVDFYPANGRYQLIVEDIDPAFTLGHMARTREQILAELRARGLDRRNAALPLPAPALRIGVLTSIDSDGWNDFRQQLETSGIGFDVTCYSIRVQGEALRPTALAGLCWFAERAADFDVLCILRGGGSRSDLAWFDDLELAIAVAQHPLKIICGIGHQRDQSVLDVISHSEKTPTAVAAHLVEQVENGRRLLEQRARVLGELATARLLDVRRHLNRRGEQLRSRVHARLAAEVAQVGECARRLERAAHARLRSERERLLRSVRDLTVTPARRVAEERKELAHKAAKIRLLDPGNVLQRGYTMVRARGGAIIKSARVVAPGTPLDVIFRDGTIRTTADKTQDAAR